MTIPRKLKYREVTEIRETLLKEQEGFCAICDILIKDEGKVPCLDHDHDLGHIRGVLCGNCNSMEGKITNCANRAKRGQSYQTWLERMMDYLMYHKESRTNLIHPRFKTKEELNDKRKRTTKSKSKARPRRRLSKDQDPDGLPDDF